MRSTGLLVICTVGVVVSFWTGRLRENSRLAAHVRTERAAEEAFPPEETSRPAYIGLTVQQLATAPFNEFYEAMRAAPKEARNKWSAELQQMPAGERRTATARGFYKLLVEFDPAVAAAVIEATPPELQWIAATTAIAAVPPNGIKDIAEMVIKLPPGTFKGDEYDPLDRLLERWAEVDP